MKKLVIAAVAIGILFVGAPPAFAVAPTVISFTPDSGMIGDSVTICRNGFHGGVRRFFQRDAGCCFQR